MDSLAAKLRCIPLPDRIAKIPVISFCCVGEPATCEQGGSLVHYIYMPNGTVNLGVVEHDSGFDYFEDVIVVSTLLLHSRQVRREVKDRQSFRALTLTWFALDAATFQHELRKEVGRDFIV